MGFDYDKLKSKGEDGGSYWTSYSDLFMVLSVVFLLLYVVTSMRSGAAGIQKQIEFKQMKEDAADLRQQIKVYNTLKEEYLEKEASKDEEQVYKELMDKLTLLQDEQAKEKDNLRKQAMDNEKKEMALNKYQQIVRNIINANMLSKAKIKKRDRIIKASEETIAVKETEIALKESEIKENLATIADQDQEIEIQSQTIEEKQQIIFEKQRDLEQKQNEIGQLESEIKDKREAIEQNQKRIASLNSNLGSKINELKATQTQHKTSKEKLLKDIQKLKRETESKIVKLQAQNRNVSAELSKAGAELQEANSLIQSQEAEQAKLAGELERAGEELRTSREQYQKQVAKLRAEHAAGMQAERSAFEKKLESEKLTGAALKERMARFNLEAKNKEAALNQKIGDLSGKFEQTRASLTQVEEEKGRALASVDKLSKQNKVMAEDLERIRKMEEAQRRVAENLKKKLQEAGIGGINTKTGDVTLSFEKEFFDRGKSELKAGMMETLARFMPKYTQGLFDDAKIADKIQSVEITGFASPTYKGKYIDPNSLNEVDRKAAQYNMDLSIERAKAIFNHIFDRRKLSYKYQDKLRPLVKVTGRGFFEAGRAPAGAIPGMNEKEFCKKFDCNQAQRVIIKFNIKK
ncbi:MAG: hypothetical protein A2X86_13430 [Bdellovibrionales bacterium GWA2_49_15]|nr:MAG: hypothetical protein A2X86_13430 [Bdellovibrionales bacterium GWA2_49_15]HAZ13527.1 hypothetical protein [Bdellovibrionales bacterium]